jgi:hypothetical protein
VRDLGLPLLEVHRLGPVGDAASTPPKN